MNGRREKLNAIECDVIYGRRIYCMKQKTISKTKRSMNRKHRRKEKVRVKEEAVNAQAQEPDIADRS